MHNVSEALESIRMSSGLDTLKFNSAGVAELIFDGDVSVLLIKRNETDLEFATLLNVPGFDGEPIALRALLHANYLGDAVGASRLALDPEDDKLLLCERVNVSGIEAAALEKRLLEFVKHAAFWHSDAANGLFGPQPDRPPSISHDNEFMIRI